MDFSTLPPEINSALMYTGAGPGPLLEAAAAWNTLSSEISSVAGDVTAAIGSLPWAGPSSEAMRTGVQPYLEWLQTSAAQAQATAEHATAAAGAYSAAFAMTVPPPLIAANRAQLLALIATNLLGQNTPVIAATEAAYEAMWTQDAAAMNAYASSSRAATSALPQFTAPPQTTSGSAAPAATTAQPAAGTGPILTWLEGLLNNSSVPGQYLQAFISSGALTQTATEILSLLPLFGISAATEQMAQTITSTASASARPVVSAAGGAVRAAIGIANRVDSGLAMSTPPSWALPQQTRVPPINVAAPPGRFQAGIPVPPAVPVVTAGRSAQSRVRQDPEYGHVSKVLPPRNPAGG